MNSNKTNKLKLLVVGAFVAFSQFTYAQSIKVEQYETSSGSTFLVEYGSFFSLANSQRICQQDSVKLTATGFSGSTITWTTPNSTTIIGASIWVDESGSYSVSDGTSTASTSLNQSSFAPVIYSNEYPVSESTSEYDVDDTTSSTPGGFIPLFQSTEKHKWLTPESRQSAYSKMQFMMTAKELLDFGFEEGTILNEIGFNYTDEYYECNTSGHNFQIRVYEITDTTLTGFETTNSNYLGSFSCGTRSEGWNYFGIGGYQWNGTANLVFEFDGYTNGGSTSSNPEIEIKETPSNRSVISVYGQSITSSTPSYSIDYRPLVSFKYKRPARQDSIIICDGSSDLYVSESASSYSWASSSGAISTDSYLSNHSNGGTLYLTASESGSYCKYIDTTEIIFNNLATPTVSASSTDFCEGETVTLTASSNATVDFVWSNGIKGSSSLISDGGDYTVTATDEFGCSKTSSEITITEISKPVLLKSLAASAVYNNETHNLTADDGSTASISSLEHLFDFGSKKYFVSKYKNDSANYVNVVSSNSLAEIGLIQSDAINDVFMEAHLEKYNQNSSRYPSRIFTGARWNSSTSSPVWLDGSTSSYQDYGSPSSDDYYFYHYYSSDNWWWRGDFTTSSSYGALIAYDNSSLALQNGEIVCDSIELFAPSSFSSYVWSTGETTESIWVSGSGSHSISLTGTYTKSDGTTCSLTSDTYTFTINSSPSLSITNNSGTVDLTGSNYIDLEAVYTSGAAILWSTGVTGDTVNIYSKGDYSVTASLNGCSTTRNVQVYEPIYVAKTGDNSNDGSFANPYLTIQKGIDEASEGQKIYVLPGTYNEGELDFETAANSGVYKNVYIASDLVRLDDSSAIASTIIDADGDEFLISISGSNSSIIQGFTLTGQEAGSNWESSVLRLHSGANLTFRDLIVRDNSPVNNAQEAQVMNVRYQGTKVVFDNVHFKDNASQGNESRKTAFIYNYASVDFINCTWEGNYGWESVVRVQYYASAYFENNLFVDNYAGDWGIVDIHDSYSKITFMNSSIVNNLDVNNERALIGIGGNNNTVQFINSVLGSPASNQDMIKNNSSTTNSFIARNSVLSKDTVDGATYSNKLVWDVDATNIMSDPRLDTDGTLLATSPAIGLATKNPVTIGSTTYTPPLLDLAGVTRPDPAGSNPDAGAYESDKAQGDLDIILTQCAYLLEATVLNSTNYTYSWSLNGTVVSTDLSYLATALGTYTFEVVSTDRSQTISEDIILNDPLTYDLVYANNNCSVLSNDNGEIRFGNPFGGNALQYTAGINYENGSNHTTHNNISSGWYYTQDNMSTGKYYVYVEDNSGCVVGDTVEIADQARDTYYVSTTGSNSNTGTSSTDAFASIATAVDYACTNDTIIILDGTYYEDSLDIKKNLVIGSQYLFDNDTNHIAATVIDGENDGWIMHWIAGYGSWSDTTTNQLVGLTIQNGSSTNSDYAGGLTVDNSDVLKVSHVRFKDNENSQGSGGAIRTRSSSYVELSHVDLYNNSANQAGAIYADHTRSRYFDLDVKGNSSTGSSGSAIYMRYAYEFISDNVKVRNNSNLAQDNTIYLELNYLDSDAIIRNWSVTGNSARAKMFWVSQPKSDKKLYIENCLIAGNTTERGSPGLRISNTSNEVIISNSTIVDNTSTTEYTKTSASPLSFKYLENTPTISILNSIISRTTSVKTIGYRDDIGVDLYIENSFIDGGLAAIELGATNATITYGTTNLTSGLYFTDAANGDYSLSNVSTLLGAGASTATVGGISITAPTTDLYGNPRPNPAGTTPDIGAIESPESAPQVGIAAVTTDNGFCQTTSGAITANLLNYTGTATYSWSSSTYPTWTWNATQSATGLSSGDYKVVAIDASSGAKIDSTEITIATLPSISITNTSTDVTCFGDDDGELTFEIYGGNPLGGSQYTYSVDYLQTMAQATGVVLSGSYFDQDNNSNARTNKYNADNYNGNPIYQGKYYVSVSDQDGCAFTDTVEVGYDHALPVVNITTLASDQTVGLTSMCEGTGNVINLTANVTGGGGTNTFSWNNASTAQTVGVAQTGEYVIEVTDQYTCVGKDTMSIYFQAAPQLAFTVAPAFSGGSLTGTYANDGKYLGSYNGHEYYAVESNVSWSTAKVAAQALGGHLAIPDDALENTALGNMTSSSGIGGEPWIGVEWNGSKWIDINGNDIVYTNWWGSTSNPAQHSLPYHNNAVLNGSTWYNYSGNGYSNYFIIEFAPTDAPVTFNQAFCDSIELKANSFVSADGPGFTEIYWTNSQGDTINETQYKTFYADSVITLNGVFTRSDGQTCDISSTTYSFDVFSSPNLVVTNYSGTADLLGSDTIVLVATTDAGTVSWVDSAGTVTNNDTLLVTQPGIYTAKAATANCESFEDVQVYKPIYVAKTGDNTTGDGSFANPFLTIQHGVNVASEGQKIYVLPGTYSEGELDFETSSGVYKSVYLASDLVRTGDSTAIAGTKIDADGNGSIINVRGSNSSVIQGFTLTGQETSAWESSVIYLSNAANLQFKNIVIKGNTWVQDARAHCFNIFNSSPIFEDVLIEGHGNSSTYTRATSYISGSNTYATFKNVVWKDNFAWDYGILGVWSGATVIAENNLFIDNGHSSWRGIINIHDQSTVTLLNSTVANNLHSESQLISFWDATNTTRLNLINSVLGDMNNVDYQIYNNGYNEAYVTARNSVVPEGILGSNQPTKINWDVDATNIMSDPRLDTDGTLLATSPAIGLATKNPVTIGSTTYTPPLLDLAGVTRPDPAGSNPDAGAYESDKAQGDLDIILTQCAYLLEATVLNSTNYTYSWSLNGTVVSTDLSYLATALGTYTFEVVSTDRSQTISEDIILSDPLTYDLVYANNNCSALSSDNGEISWGGATGGDRNTVDSWEYRTGINNENGTQYDGTWNIDEDTWYNTRSGMASGKYYVYVEDNSGCVVGDTVEIADQARDTYYVSTTGSNSNTGTSSTDAFASIATAVDYACTNDTIIILDGTYYEDSLDIKKNLVIGSQYLFDNDTNHIAATVIDGENDGWIMHWIAGYGSWSDTTTNQLVGLTIQNGSSTNSDYAGGLTVDNSDVLKVSHVRFKDNENSQGSGGAIRTRSSSYVELSHVDLYNNSANQAGAIYADHTRSRYFDLDVKGNSSTGSSGSAIYMRYAYEFISDNVKVRNNSNLAQDNTIYLELNYLDSDAIIRNWSVTGNSARAKMFWVSQPKSDKKLYIENCLIAGNTTERGSPGLRISNTSNEVIISNSTIVDNTSTTEYTKTSASPLSFKYLENTPTISILNSIISRTTSVKTIGYRDDIGVDLYIENSFIDGGLAAIELGATNATITYGTTNLTSGLYFTDAANGDYSLSNVSTLLGAGASTATVGGISITAPTTDLYGNPRPNPAGTTPDIGAIESPESAPQVGIAAVTTDNGFCQTTSGAITANLLNYTGTATYSWSSSTYPTWTWNATQSATGLSSGDYKVVAIDASSGAKIDSTEITIATLPSISITNTSTDVTCFGDDDGELTFEIYGGNPLGGSQYTYSVDYLQTMAQATGVVLSGSYFDQDNNSNARTNKYNADNYNGNPIYQGKYYVSVSDQDGCAFTDTVEVGYDHALPVVNITTLASDQTVGLTSMCEGTGNVINLTANVTGGGGTNTFAWSNASTAQTVGVAQTGDYIIEVTDNNTCVGKDTIDIYFQGAPQLVVEGAGTPLYNGTALPSGVGNYNWGNNSQYLGNYDGSAYYIIQNSYQSSDGIAIAKALGGKLATPRTKAESDWLADEYSDYGCCDAMIGARYDGTTWVDFDGNELSWSDWWGNSVNGVGNPLNGNPATDNYDMAVLSTNREWINYQTNDHWWLLLEFPPLDAPVTFNQAFCDSIELKANSFVSADGPGFTEIYWTNSQGDTINETQYKTFYADSVITLNGVFTRSDGQTCEISSTTYSFDVFSSPNLLVTNYNGTADLLGSDTIVLVATTDAGTVSWVDSAGTVTNNDTLLVTQPGIYTAKAATANCESFENVQVYKPIYVAKTGDNTTGDGSFANPFLTIQHGIDIASEGQKIYVLPGTYEEQILITKPVYLASNYLRLGDSSAHQTTIIKPGSTSKIEDVNNSNLYSYGGVSIVEVNQGEVVINGFTIKDFEVSYESWDRSGALSVNNNNAGIRLHNIIISGTRQKQNANCCPSAHVLTTFYSGNVEVKNLIIKNSGSSAQEVNQLVHIRQSNMSFEELVLEDNYVGGDGFFEIDNGSNISLVNSLIDTEVNSNFGSGYTFKLSQSNFISINSTFISSDNANYDELIYLSGSGQNVLFHNSVVEGKGFLGGTGTNNTVTMLGSVLPVNSDFSLSGLGITLDTSSVIFADPQLNSNGTLKSNSPAIGIGLGQPYAYNNQIVIPPSHDLVGQIRPDPVGSNRDAGAYESDMAQGNFDLVLSQCGYLITAQVLNSANYTLDWSSGGTILQSGAALDYTASAKGQYKVTALSIDRQDTIVKTIALTNPLEFDFSRIKDVCESNGLNSGQVYINNYSGATTNTNDWWEYRMSIYDENGSQVWNNSFQDNYGEQGTSNISAGRYYIELQSHSGCAVGDSVVLQSIPSKTWWLSTTGSDLNDGTELSSLSTIEEALSRACDGDTIILQDGTYFENVEMDWNSGYVPMVTIASEYLLDSNLSHISNTVLDGMNDASTIKVLNSGNYGNSDSLKFIGFTVQNGKSSSWPGGGGLSIRNSYVSLDAMIVSNNESGNNGGGIAINDGQVSFKNTVVENNYTTGSGGGIWIEYQNETVVAKGDSGLIIRNNYAENDGGGLYYQQGLWNSQDSYGFENITVEGNSANYSGGGINFSTWDGNATLSLVNSKVVNNISRNGSGGGIYLSSGGGEVEFSNIIVSQNKNDITGGIYVNNADLILISSTIYQNEEYSASAGSNSAVNLENTSDLHLWNTIIGGQDLSTSSTGWIIDTDDYSDHTIEFVSSQVEGGLSKINATSNSGTIQLDPTTGPQISQNAYLVNPQLGNFSPSPASQAVGSGSIITTSSTLSSYSVPLTDINGLARAFPAGSSPDLGAVETEDSTFIYGAALQVRNNIACDPAFGRIKATALNGHPQGTPRYTFTDLTGNLQWSTFVNQPTATVTSLPNGLYEIKVEDIVNGSVENEFTDTIQISGKDSLNVFLTSVDEFCLGDNDGSVYAAITGGSGAYEYTWATPNQGLASKTGSLGNLSPDRYIISVKDGDGCFAVDSIDLGTLHLLPTVNIASTLSQNGTITTGGSDVRACNGDGITLDAGPGQFAYAWTTSNQLNTITTQTITAPYNETYYVEVTDQYGCKNTDTSSVYFVQRPLVFASNVNQVIGQAGQQVTAYVEGGNQRSSNSWEAQVYGTDYTHGKYQYIIPANELISSGMTEQTTINSLGMEVSNATGEPIQNFEIKLKHTTKNQADNQFDNSGLTEVLSFPLMTVGEGWNTHNFTTPFEWNGTNNLLVEISYATTSFNSGQGNVSYVGSEYSYNTTGYSQQNSQIIGTYAPSTSSFRPKMKFGIDKIQATDTLRVCDFTMLNTTDDYDAYSWLVNGSSAGTQLRYSVLQPKQVTLQTTDVASGCVMYSDTIQVLLDTTPAVILVDESIAMCSGDTVYGMVNNVDNDLTYWWSNNDSASTTALYSGNDYYIYAQAPSGCTGIDTLQVIENIPPDVIMELNGRVLTTTDGSIVNTSSAVSGCDTLLKMPYLENVDHLTDNSLDGWSTYSSQGLAWDVEMQWDTIQDFTGPTYDADSNVTGNWFQFDPAAITDENKIGFLQSNCLSLLGVSQPYLDFEYHMSDVYADSSSTSDQMGSLYVEVKNVSDNGQWNTVFAKSGSQGLDWIDHTISLSAYAGKTIQVRFKAQAGVGGSRSEMGLDNIFVSAYDLNNASTAPSLRLDPLTVCEGDSLKATAISNGSQSFTYLWNTSDTTDYLILQNSGYYHAIILDDKNCEVGTDSVYIEVNPAPNTIVSLSDTTMYCDGDFNGISLSVEQGYRNYQWSQVTDSGAVSTADSVDAITVSNINLGANSYYVVITDSIGCQATSLPVDLILNPNPSISLTAGDVLCYGESTGGVIPTIIGSGGYDYVWSTGDTTSTIDSLITGTYTLSVTDSFSCLSVDSITVDQPSLFTYTVTSVEDVNCYSGSDGIATYNVSGGVGNYSYAWTDSIGTWTSTGKDLQFAPIGTYYVAAQDSNGCEILDTVRIEQPNELVLTLDSTKNLDCYQSGDGAVWATVVGGIGGNEFRLNGVTVTDVDVAQLSAGSYTLVVEDDNGCMDSLSFTLTEPQLLTATNYTSQYVGGYEISCNGNTDGFIQVDVSGGTLPYTYEWTDSVSTEDRSVLAAGNYTLKVTDVMGCEVFTSANLFEPSQLVASSSLQELFCYGDSTAELTYSVGGGVGPYVTSWNSMNGFTPDSVNVTFQVDLRGVSPDASGIRLIRNGGGSFTMSMVSALNDSIYRVTLTMAPGEQIMYRFFNGSTAETVNPSCGINNSVSVIERTFTAGMNDTSLAVFGFSECTTYGGSRSGAYVDYLRNIVGLASDVYYQTFVDMNGCTITLVDTVVEPAPLVLTIDSISNVTCKDASDASVAVTVTGGNGNYSYTWNGLTSSTEDISGVGAGQYTLVVIDDKGCTDSLSVTITEPDSLLASYVLSAYVGGNNVSCNGATDGSFDVSVQGGTLPYSYTWNTSDTTEDLSSIGQGYYSLNVTDANGCAVSVADSIVEPNVLSATIATTDVSCNGGTDGTVAVNVAGGSGPYLMERSSNTGASMGNINVTFRVDMSNISNVGTVQLVTRSGQSSTMTTNGMNEVYMTTLLVGQNDTVYYRYYNGSSPELVPTSCGVLNNTFFEREVVLGTSDTTLAVTGYGSCSIGGTAYAGAFLSATQTFGNLLAGDYTMSITDMNGCTITLVDTVVEPAPLVLTIDSISNVTCKDASDASVAVTVTGGNGNYSYTWNGLTSSTEDISGVGAGQYTLVVIDDKGCTDSLSVTITEPDSLLASYVLSAYVGGNNVSCNGATDGSFDVSVQGGTLPYSYTWNTSDTTEDLSSIGQGYYSLNVTDANGCAVSVADSIVEPNVLSATIATTDVSCNGGTDGTVAVNVAGGSGPYTVNWSASNGGQVNSAIGVTFRVDMGGKVIDPSGVDVVFGSGQAVDMITVADSIYLATAYFNVGDTVKYRFFNGSSAELVPVTCGVTQNLTLFERQLVVAADTTLPAVFYATCNSSSPGTGGYAVTATDSLTSVTSGTFTAIIVDANGCTITVQDSVMQPDVLAIALDTLIDASCPQSIDGYIGVTVSGGTGNYTFNWDNGDTTQSIDAGYGYYDLTVTDENGCQDTASYFVNAPFPYNDEELCVVTVDTTGVNLLVWEKTPSQRTADYILLRENAATQYVSVGNNTYLNMSTWADQNSNPAVQPYRYKLVLQDSCGNYSDTSDYHATIHLQASQGVAQNEVNLQWTAYEGKQVQTYYIYRWLSPINRVLVDSVSSNVYTYTDIYPVTTTITALLYEVGAKFVNGGCSPSTGKQSSYANSMSNVLDWGQDGGLPIGTEEWVDVVLGNDLDIYPNPTRGALNLELKGAWEEQDDIQIKITDMTGRILANRVTQGAGTVRFDFEELPAGIYFLNIITGEGRTIVKRFERVN